jgi:ethanolamine transporter EutH
MQIRRKIIAPVLLTLGTAGSLVAGPVLALTTAATPAANSVAAAPAMWGVHG